MRKTKIVATLGPATDNPEVLKDMIKAGLDVARFNFSHGTHEEIIKRVNLLRSVCEEMGAIVALLADTKGPEVRLGDFVGGKAELVTDTTFTMVTDQIEGTAQKASISYEGVIKDIKPGARILLDDGQIELVAEQITSNSVTTRVINGGIITNKKSINIPGVSLNIPYISAKDRSDLRLITENGFHYIAASFVRSASDVQLLKEELHRMGGEHINIISKIENADGVANTDAILAISDGLMVARGDLGVELEFEEIPIIQKELIKKAYQQGKNVITATQMLESMITHPRPTRAEASDVANAIYDGTSAIMLSAETAMGKFPVQAVKTMAKIATRTESDIDYGKRFHNSTYKPEPSVTNAISHATVTTAHDLDLAAILIVSKSGHTARNVSKFRPLCPIIVGTPDPVVQHQLKMAWGIVPILTTEETTSLDVFSGAINVAKKGGFINEGDMIVITAGIPVGHSGTTNLLKVHEVGEKISVF
jgi:pyruvate kinase